MHVHPKYKVYASPPKINKILITLKEKCVAYSRAADGDDSFEDKTTSLKDPLISADGLRNTYRNHDILI